MKITLELSDEEQDQIFKMIHLKIHNCSGTPKEFNLATRIVKLNPELVDKYVALARLSGQIS